jgi:tetratricopeptide (TPR) repeat protein
MLLLLPAALAQNYPAGYTDPAVCATCHAKEAEGYRKTGMGRSFYKPSPDRIVEDFTRNNKYYHKASDTWFSMLQRDGKIFQRQYQIGFDGKQTNVLEKPVDYVVGSGNHSRTYLARTAKNTLIELPLAWYAEKGGYFAMNPGYDAPDHEGFRRKIGYDCAFCHNAYPAMPAGVQTQGTDAVFPANLPEGIDCQRCHGPGGKHVEATRNHAAQAAISGSIVNPAKLTPQRQLDVCRQCHLETTSSPLPNSVVKYDRDIFSYRPGQALEDFKLFFTRENKTDRVEIASAAFRLDQSQCMLKSNGKLTCTTCHNPHDIKHGQEGAAAYTAACRSCHNSDFNREVAAGKHTASSDCVTCHMPKRRTDDVVHAVMTDHYIQRHKPDRDLLADIPERQETYRGEVKLYYPAALSIPSDELYVAAAQVMQSSSLEKGIPRLTAAIASYRPALPQPYLELADALRSAGRCKEAIPVYNEAAVRGPHPVEAVRKQAICTGGSEAMKKAIALAPDDALTWTQLGIAYVGEGRKTEAIAAFEKAISLDKEVPEAYNNLGGLRQTTDPARAEPALREAIRLQPNYAEARNNLAGLLSLTDRFDEARFEFEAALRYKANYSFGHYNYGIALARANHFPEAQKQLELALQIEPNSADMHHVLGIIFDAQKLSTEAIAQYREALRIRPDFPRAALSLGAAMIDAGDRPAALVYLRQAAGAADAAIRSEAQRLLKAP